MNSLLWPMHVGGVNQRRRAQTGAPEQWGPTRMPTQHPPVSPAVRTSGDPRSSTQRSCSPASGTRRTGRATARPHHAGVTAGSGGVSGLSRNRSRWERLECGNSGSALDSSPQRFSKLAAARCSQLLEQGAAGTAQPVHAGGRWTPRLGQVSSRSVPIPAAAPCAPAGSILLSRKEGGAGSSPALPSPRAQTVSPGPVQGGYRQLSQPLLCCFLN